MNASACDWIRLRNVLILLLGFSFCLYLPCFFHEVFADDEIYLAFTNRFLRESTWSDLYQLFLKPANPWEFLPLRDFTYWLDFRLYGDEPMGFHATNLVWYACLGIASFWLFLELIRFCRPAWGTHASVFALCGTLIFVVHPAHVEAVAWIASRKDLLAGTFGLLSFAMLVRALRYDWSFWEMLLAALLLALACFGKASAMTNLLFMTVLMGVAWTRSPAIRGVRKSGYLLLFWALVTLVWVIHWKVGEASGIRIENHPGWWAMIERASRIFTALIGILLFPYPLRFYYDVYLIGDGHWLVSVGAVLLLFISLWVLLQKRSLWAFGVVLMLSPMVVYLQLIPFTTWSLASERFVFVSVAGLALVLIDLLARISRPAVLCGLMVALVLPNAAIVWSRINDWADSRSLLAREYALQPAFHNAIRDRIVFVLLPEGRYGEASNLARQVPRLYAKDALLSLVGVELAYRQMRDAESTIPGGSIDEVPQGFCRAVDRLRAATFNGYARIRNEPDVSYNNLLRTFDRQLEYRYAAAKIICGERSARKD